MNIKLCLLLITTLFLKAFEQYQIPETRSVKISVPAYPKSTKAINQTNLSSSATNMYTIQQSGKYYLGSSLEASPSGTNRRVIKIAVSNVVLDLNGMTITQAHNNSQSGLNAIDIASNLSNITIMNGFINNVSDVGINVASGCNNIRLLNVGISNCDGGGAQFDTANIVLLDKVSITKCNGTGTSTKVSSSAIGLYMTTCSSVKIDNCNFDGNQASGSRNGYGGYILTCTNVKISNSSFSSNKGNSGRGLTLATNCVSCTIDNCTFSNNQGTSGAGDGCVGTGQAFIYKNCKFLNNTGTVNASGLNVNTIISCVLENCELNYNNTTTGGSAFGLLIINGRGTVVKKCTVSRTNSTAAAAYGIALLSTQGHIIDSCTCSKNTTTSSGTTYGIYVENNVTNCIVTNNLLLDNTGAGDNYGYYDATAAGTGTTTMLGGNISFGHGACSPPNGTNLTNSTGGGNYYFQLNTPASGTNSPDKMIQEIKIGRLAESGTSRVTTAGFIGKFGRFDNLSLIK